MHDNEPKRDGIDRAYRVLLGTSTTFVRIEQERMATDFPKSLTFFSGFWVFDRQMGVGFEKVIHGIDRARRVLFGTSTTFVGIE